VTVGTAKESGKGDGEGEALRRSPPTHCLEALFVKDRLSHTGSLVRGLIHNLNGPLQNMSMLLELLAKGHDRMDEAARDLFKEDPDQWARLHGHQRERIDRLTQQLAVFSDMLRDFVVLHEVEVGEGEVDINLVLSKLARVFVADLFFKHQVELELKFSERLPFVKVAGRHLIPTLMHLFDNAVTSLKGCPVRRISVESKAEAGRVRVFIRDTGCGFDGPEAPDDLFRPFHSAWPESVLAHCYDKAFLGFGLFAARRLLEPYGGSVSLSRVEEETVAAVELPVS
jgi:C4-dicarboxylate-specific signal transduction histidine kinase